MESGKFSKMKNNFVPLINEELTLNNSEKKVSIH